MALAGCVVLALSLWFLGQPVVLHWGRAAVLGLVAVATLGLGASLLSARPVSLRWDEQRWHLGPADSVGHEPVAGTLAVALDLGSWMLLRFQADASGRRAAVAWLPAQRRGLESQWHALRCAVYSPRPAPDADAAANP